MIFMTTSFAQEDFSGHLTLYSCLYLQTFELYSFMWVPILIVPFAMSPKCVMHVEMIEAAMQEVA